MPVDSCTYVVHRGHHVQEARKPVESFSVLQLLATQSCIFGGKDTSFPMDVLAGMLVLSEAVFWVLRVFRFCFFCCILNLNLVPATRFSLVHLEDHNVSLRESTAVLPVH